MKMRVEGGWGGGGRKLMNTHELAHKFYDAQMKTALISKYLFTFTSQEEGGGRRGGGG